jgi:phage terminase small subunit
MPQLQNKREEVFVRARLSGLNKSRAAVVAGFSPRSAAQIGSELSRRPTVLGRMEELRGIVIRVLNAIDGEPEAERVEREFGLCAHKLHGSR